MGPRLHDAEGSGGNRVREVPAGGRYSAHDGDAALALGGAQAHDAPSTLIEGRQPRRQVCRVARVCGHFCQTPRYLTQRLHSSCQLVGMLTECTVLVRLVPDVAVNADRSLALTQLGIHGDSSSSYTSRLSNPGMGIYRDDVRCRSRYLQGGLPYLGPSRGGVCHHGEVVALVSPVLCQGDACVNGRLPRCHRHVGCVGHLQRMPCMVHP